MKIEALITCGMLFVLFLGIVALVVLIWSVRTTESILDMDESMRGIDAAVLLLFALFICIVIWFAYLAIF